ncbi:MAG: diguanylate cyclase [Spirochaetes bacterium]|nr:diguanylate cyclase [Spirochaetota bacterium]
MNRRGGGSLKELSGWLSGRSLPLLYLLFCLSVLLIGEIDLLTGDEVVLSALYLLPVAVMAWLLGGKHAFAASLASIAAMFLVDVRMEHTGFHASQAINAGIRLTIFFFVSFLVARVRTQHLQLRDLAVRDALTGLANLRGALQALDLEYDRSRRSGRPLTAISLDADRFKEVNDTRGHAAGDEVLRRIGKALAATLRRTDTAARMGGDEFLVLLPETDARSAGVFAEKMRGRLLASMKEGGFPVTFSIGGTTFLRPPGSIDEILKTVDRAMYRVKRGGRNGVRMERFPAPSAPGRPRRSPAGKRRAAHR